MVALTLMPTFFLQEQCRSIAGPEVPSTRNSAFLGATSPMTPGRGQMMSGRGRCFLEVGSVFFLKL